MPEKAIRVSLRGDFVGEVCDGVADGPGGYFGAGPDPTAGSSAVGRGVGAVAGAVELGGVGEPAGELLGEEVDGLGYEAVAVWLCEVVGDEFAQLAGGGSVQAVAVAGVALPALEDMDSSVGFDPLGDGVANAVGQGSIVGRGGVGGCFLNFREILVRARVYSLPLPVILSCTPFLGNWLFPCCFPVVSLLLFGCFYGVFLPFGGFFSGDALMTGEVGNVAVFFTFCMVWMHVSCIGEDLKGLVYVEVDEGQDVEFEHARAPLEVAVGVALGPEAYEHEHDVFTGVADLEVLQVFVPEKIGFYVADACHVAAFLTTP